MSSKRVESSENVVVEKHGSLGDVDDDARGSDVFYEITDKLCKVVWAVAFSPANAGVIACAREQRAFDERRTAGLQAEIVELKKAILAEPVGAALGEVGRPFVPVDGGGEPFCAGCGTNHCIAEPCPSKVSTPTPPPLEWPDLRYGRIYHRQKPGGKWSYRFEAIPADDDWDCSGEDCIVPANVPFDIWIDDPTFKYIIKAVACGDDGDEHAHLDVSAALLNQARKDAK